MAKFYINGFSFLEGDATVENFAPYFEARRLRRMEIISKNALFCSAQALSQAGLDIHAPKEMGLSVAVGAGSLESTCKFMDSIIDDGDELSSPTAFAGSVHNSTGLTLSLFLHLNGPCVTTGQFDFSFAGALLTAQEFLEREMCAEVLVSVAEDINPVAAEYAPRDRSLFSSVIRNPEGPFVRAAAAFILSKKPTPYSLFAVEKLSFSRTENFPDFSLKSPSTSAWAALQTARLLAKQQPFIFRDDFAGANFLLEAVPYVKP